MDGIKNVLVIAAVKKVEALRMASGLTLLDDRVAIASLGDLPATPDAAEQMEALEFAEVPLTAIGQDMSSLARKIIESDVVFCV